MPGCRRKESCGRTQTWSWRGVYVCIAGRCLPRNLSWETGLWGCRLNHLCVTSRPVLGPCTEWELGTLAPGESTLATMLTGPHLSVPACYSLGSLYWPSPFTQAEFSHISLSVHHCDNLNGTTCHLCYLRPTTPLSKCRGAHGSSVREQRRHSLCGRCGESNLCAIGKSQTWFMLMKVDHEHPFTRLLLYIFLD